MSRPSLLSITATISAGMLVGLAAPSLARVSAWLVAAGVAVGCVLVCVGCWMAALRERYERVAQAEAQASIAERSDPQAWILERLARLTPEQVELVSQQVVRVSLEPHPRRPVTMFDLTGILPPAKIPISFAWRVLRDSDEERLAPQRDYSGAQRQWYVDMLRWLDFHGMIAEMPAGNQPARWTPGGYNAACTAFALSAGDDDEEDGYDA